jgi:ABC-2 type transport system ATP-binding protein
VPSVPLAELRGLRHRYGKTLALDGLDLEVRPGEVLGLVGPNGAGKTTALSALVGILRPQEGEVRVGGRDLGREPLEARRRLSFVPDGAPLYAELSPRQHLALVGRLRGLPEERIRAEGERLLGGFDLVEKADDPVRTLSHGQRQKTALACALLPGAPLLVLDEPLSGLDAPSAMVVKEVLRGQARRGGGVLYTSHLLDVAERVCDRVAILVRGRVVAQGTLEELARRAGRDGTLEELFATLAESEDPGARARQILG